MRYICKNIKQKKVVQVEMLDQPGVHLLLANTHLFFHPKADLIRLIQAIISTKHLEKLKNDLVKMENVKKVSILLGGDFNSDPPSWAFKYVSSKSIPYNDLSEGKISFFVSLMLHFVLIFLFFFNRGNEIYEKL